MERRSVSDLIAELEPLLRRFEGDEDLVITNAEEEEGCRIGDNYMSVVMRTTVTGSRGNGTSYSKSLMTKYLPHHRQITTSIRGADLFHNEFHFYDKLIPVIGNFGPTCIHADPDKVIMEDLKPLGYVVNNRHELLDLDHSLAAVRVLAQLHASSLALKLKDPTGFSNLMNPLKEALFPSDSGPCLGTSVDWSIRIAISQLEKIEQRDEDLEAGLSYLKSREGRAYEELRSMVESGGRKFDVLTHGDCWNNNVMFKHDDDGKVTDVKLLDFQISRHVTPALDFHYFVYSSPKSMVIEDHYEDLVIAYHSSFLDVLRAKHVPLGLMGQLNLEWFKSELKTFANYGLFTGCWIVNAVLGEVDDAPNMDDITMEMIEEMSRTLEPKVSPKIVERLGCIVSDYARRYI